MQPKRPGLITDYAEQCLDALAKSPLAEKISLGGAFGLMHYFEYRATQDVDAWWAPETAPEEREQIIQLLSDALAPYGKVSIRTWGEVVSIELKADNAKVFSFQIAQRSAQLKPAEQSPWHGVKVDSLEDLIASKMVALVERGAPRDFLDVYTLCQNNMITAVQCWQLWQQRQRKSGSNAHPDRAKLALQTHLARIEQHRPLDNISDLNSRESAEQLRNWFKSDFMEALHD